MKLVDFFVLVVLLAALGLGLYLLWDNWPSSPVQFKGIIMDEVVAETYSNGTQFYPNMRYPDKEISYTIERSCSAKKTEDIVAAFSIISDKTVLNFNRLSSRGEIDVLCSNIAPEPEEVGHFIAGEGGPKEIYISGPYYVIVSGQVALFRAETCDDPNIALHEIIHALGFDHNDNPGSIMYNITGCNKRIDQYIIDDISRLYSVPSAPDLIIINASAEKAGKYLSFMVEIANYGLKEAQDVNLSVYANNQKVKEFAFREIDLGTRKEITVTNVPIPRDTVSISFEAYLTDGSREISSNSNRVELNVVSG